MQSTTRASGYDIRYDNWVSNYTSVHASGTLPDSALLLCFSDLMQVQASL